MMRDAGLKTSLGLAKSMSSGWGDSGLLPRQPRQHFLDG